MNIKEIKARAKEATDGPWFIGHELYDDGAVCCRIEPEYRGVIAIHSKDGKIQGNLFNANPHIGDRAANNSFVAHAPQDIPDLIKALEASEKRVEKLEEVLQWINNMGEGNIEAFTKSIALLKYIQVTTKLALKKVGE